TLCARTLGASRFGRVLRAARETEQRVTAAGLNIRRARLIAYAVAGAIGALAGWLLAVHAEFVSPAIMEWRISGELLVMVILGGAATPEGAALGAIALTLGEAALGGATEHWRLILGPLIVLLALTGRRQRRPA
ncbi:MAG TPA: branched-chain amino acid ABC transporter permease, partial [Acetobacteraceae bacterium]|nr:branched-chain amino acid ABC transporter permease [Acetobacteraceae bacterium]